MMLDKECDGDWVCIEPVVRVAGVELQFTFVIELALPIEVILFLHVTRYRMRDQICFGHFFNC